MTVHHVKLQKSAGFDLYFLSTIMFSINYTEYQNFLLQIADDSRSSLLTFRLQTLKVRDRGSSQRSNSCLSASE